MSTLKHVLSLKHRDKEPKYDKSIPYSVTTALAPSKETSKLSEQVPFIYGIISVEPIQNTLSNRK